MSYTIYMVQCKDGTFYIGQTNNLQKRIKEHNEGKGAKYTRGRGPVKVVYTEEVASVNEALKREYVLKKLKRKGREKLAELSKDLERSD